MFRVSRDGTYLDDKAASEAALVVPRDQFLGRTLTEVLPPEVARPAMESVERALRTGEVQSMRYVLPLNGDRREWEDRVLSRLMPEAPQPAGVRATR
jgi:hypothetical protein